MKPWVLLTSALIWQAFIDKYCNWDLYCASNFFFNLLNSFAVKLLAELQTCRASSIRYLWYELAHSLRNASCFCFTYIIEGILTRLLVLAFRRLTAAVRCWWRSLTRHRRHCFIIPHSTRPISALINDFLIPTQPKRQLAQTALPLINILINYT